MGEIGTGYADGAITRREALWVSMTRYLGVNGTPACKGQMAAVGLPMEKLEELVPDDIDIACHNAYDSITVSGNTEPVKKFVKELEAKNIFAKEVDTMGFSFHSRLTRQAEGKLRSLLKGKINPKPRTERWISTAYPKDMWHLEEAKYAGVDYYAFNYCNRVRLYEAANSLPKNCIVVELSPHGLLQSPLKKTFGAGSVVTSLMKKNHPDNAQFFMEQLGKMYINGVNMKPLSMFPECQLPVPRSTPMISPMITKAWRHDEKYRIPHVDDIHLTGDSYDFDLTENGDADWLNGHVLNGIKLFPGTGYLCIAWQAMANKHNTKFEKLPVVFENVHIIRATMLPHDGKLSFKCRILENGNFEVTEGGGVAAKGKISLASDMPKTLNEMKILDDKIKALPNKKAPKIP